MAPCFCVNAEHFISCSLSPPEWSCCHSVVWFCLQQNGVACVACFFSLSFKKKKRVSNLAWTSWILLQQTKSSISKWCTVYEINRNYKTFSRTSFGKYREKRPTCFAAAGFFNRDDNTSHFRAIT
uniref:Uncharacterized protein n=1 Tax=Sphaerodactylus townsendi TaxID=933632 RepID=A0ACB8EB90_9SAUR